MHDINLILTLTGGLTAALFLGYITQRLHLSPIVGYLLAGVAVGPYTPGFAADRGLAEQLAEVGVILLMFGVGLHFHFRELYEVRYVAIPGALVQSAVATALGAVTGRMLGWDWATGLIFGGAISVASTVVLIRVLSDNRDLHTRAGHIAVGWLVVEDLLTVVALVLMPALVGDGGGDLQGAVGALGVAALKIVALIATTFVVGGRVIPWVLERIAATRSRELFTLAILVIALGIAVGSARVFGVSMALGAFLAGMIVGRSDFSMRAASEALPMRDAFAVLFFVSIGMIFDPLAMLESPAALMATLAIVLLAKPAAALAIVLVLRYPLRVALPVAISLAQIGEFSFILAALGKHLGVMPDEAVNTLVAAAIISITLNPLLYRAIGPVERWLASRYPTAIDVAIDDGADTGVPTQRAIVVGYGPVGQTVAQLLLDNEIEPTVIELNLDTVRRLKAFDVRAIYGDASRPEVLAEAGIARAASLILTSGTGSLDEEVIRRAKELNPGVLVLARTQYVRELSKLQQAGADDPFSAEGEVALAFTVRILERLGATGEQIDRERQRVEATFRNG
ncbi:MAG: cation:proton antiporter [Planctomycetia bacterium]|nr:cation:proton antiporter [Planctomycetia bacterium]